MIGSLRNSGRTYTRPVMLLIFLALLTWSFQSSFLPLFASTLLGASLAQAGSIAGILGIVGAFSATFSGAISDRVGRTKVASLGLVVWSAAIAVASQSRGYAELAALAVPLGAALGMIEPPIAALLAETTPKERLGRAFGLYSSAIQAGVALGPAIGGFLVNWYGFREPIAGMSLPLLGALAYVLLVLKEPPHKPAALRRQDLKVVRERRPIAGFLVTLTSALSVSTTVSFLPLYGKSLGFDSITIGLIIAPMPIVSMLSRTPLGVLLDRTGKERLVVFPGLGLALLAIALLGRTRTPAVMMALSSAVGVGFGSGMVTGRILVARGTGSAGRGLLMGLLDSFRFSGFSMAPVLASSVAELGGVLSPSFDLGFLSVSLLMGSLMAISYLILRGSR